MCSTIQSMMNKGDVISMECDKINLKRGSKGEQVKELQTLLQKMGYYNGRIDGDYGDITVSSVKAYQKKKSLLQDGVFGPVTCKKLQADTTSSDDKTINYTIFTNTKLCETQKPDCAGQISSYHCACHCIKQGIRRFGITRYSERTIGGYAGTTTAGTSHQGIETAIAHIARLEGINLKVEWMNFSDLGNSSKERWRKYGDLMTDDNKAAFLHELYRDYAGHYSGLKQVNTNSMGLTVQNSLGKRYGSGYYGYMESRSCSTQERYLRGISQKSVCIITKI